MGTSTSLRSNSQRSCKQGCPVVAQHPEKNFGFSAILIGGLCKLLSFLEQRKAGRLPTLGPVQELAAHRNCASVTAKSLIKDVSPSSSMFLPRIWKPLERYRRAFGRVS